MQSRSLLLFSIIWLLSLCISIYSVSGVSICHMKPSHTDAYDLIDYTRSLATSKNVTSIRMAEFIIDHILRYSYNNKLVHQIDLLQTQYDTRTVSEINTQEVYWQANITAETTSTFQNDILNNALSTYLSAEEDTLHVGVTSMMYIVDLLGAVIAMTDVTDTFAHGNLPEFINSTANCTGHIVITPRKFSISRDSWSQTLYLPIFTWDQDLSGILVIPLVESTLPCNPAEHSIFELQQHITDAYEAGDVNERIYQTSLKLVVKYIQDTDLIYAAETAAHDTRIVTNLSQFQHDWSYNVTNGIITPFMTDLLNNPASTRLHTLRESLNLGSAVLESFFYEISGNLIGATTLTDQFYLRNDQMFIDTISGCAGKIGIGHHFHLNKTITDNLVFGDNMTYQEIMIPVMNELNEISGLVMFYIATDFCACHDDGISYTELLLEIENNPQLNLEIKVNVLQTLVELCWENHIVNPLLEHNKEFMLLSTVLNNSIEWINSFDPVLHNEQFLIHLYNNSLSIHMEEIVKNSNGRVKFALLRDLRGLVLASSVIHTHDHFHDVDNLDYHLPSIAECTGSMQAYSVPILNREVVTLPVLDHQNFVIGILTFSIENYTPKHLNEFLLADDVSGIFFIIINSLITISIIVISLMMIKLRTKSTVKAMSVPFTFIMCVGGILACITAFLHIGNPNDFICNARIWFQTWAFNFFVGSLVVKVRRTVSIFSILKRKMKKHHTHSNSRHVQRSSDFYLFRQLFALTSVFTVVLIVFTIIGPSTVQIYIRNGDFAQVTRCKSEYDGLRNGILYGLCAILLIAGIEEAFLLQKLKVHEKWNDSKLLITSIYNIIVGSGLIMILYALTTESELAIVVMIKSYVLILYCGVTLGVVIIPALVRNEEDTIVMFGRTTGDTLGSSDSNTSRPGSISGNGSLNGRLPGQVGGSPRSMSPSVHSGVSRGGRKTTMSPHSRQRDIRHEYMPSPRSGIRMSQHEPTIEEHGSLHR